MANVRIPTTFLPILLLASTVMAATDGTKLTARPAETSARETAGVSRADAAELTGAAAVKLDGAFAETAWSLATPIDGFVQRDPKEGAAPSQRTEVRVLYDRTFLYVAVRAFDDDPSKIVGIRTRRDAESPSDWVSILIDSFHDRRTAYAFAVNASGVKRDTYHFADGNSDVSWDAVWDVSVTHDEQGWRAEFRIPFSQLRFEPGKRDTFGFAVIREIARSNEISSWPLIAKSRTGYVSQFGELGGLKLTSGGKRLELTPYAVAQGQSQPVEAGNPFERKSDGSGSFGADAKFAVTRGLTLTTTINPDFGQVEADPAVVNLSSFETFYQERRPFFVEGSGNLRFDLDCNDGSCTGLFYSRRIGRQPRGYPDVDDGGFVTVPAQTTILGAAKLTGRVGGFAIGGLSALTSKETATAAFGDQRWKETAEPLTNYSLIQGKREFANSSYVGFMLTNTARRLDADVDFLPGRATTGGVNWDWRLFNKRYSFSGYWAGSYVTGSADAIDELQTSSVHNYQRSDADYIDYDPTRTSLSGQAGSVGVSKISGKRVRFSLFGSFKTPGFDVNDVGYLRRADALQQSAWVQFRFDTPRKYYRNIRLNFNQWTGFTFGGDKRFAGYNINAHIVTPQNWSAGIGGNYEAAGMDDRGTRGGPSFRSKRGGNVWYYIESDNRKPLNSELNGYYYEDELGSNSWGLDPEITWRPTSFLSVSTGLSYSKSDDDSQWVENVEEASRTHYVFGRIKQTTVGVTARVNYTITPNLTVQLYAQSFVSTGAYTEFKEMSTPYAPTYEGQFTPYAYSDNPDFNYKSLRMTNVLRWEFKPGSALYVVWQQGREGSTDAGRFRFSRDFGDVFDLKSTNVFLVKFSYWLNM